MLKSIFKTAFLRQRWYVNPFSECNKTCGTGQKTRNITCSQLGSDGKYHEVSDAALCTATKPTVYRVENCNVIACTAQWVLGKWSEVCCYFSFFFITKQFFVVQKVKNAFKRPSFLNILKALNILKHSRMFQTLLFQGHFKF